MKKEKQESVLMNSNQLAALIGCSPHTIRHWHVAGFIPVPMVIRSHLYWKREEILRWIDAKCPKRSVWKKMNLKY